VPPLPCSGAARAVNFTGAGGFTLSSIASHLFNSLLGLTAVAGLALAALVTTTARAQADSGWSSTWTIHRPGSYKLYRNHNVPSGDAIVITASGVTLDLNGFRVSTGARGTGRGLVVQGAKGVAITGGSVSGFNANVAITDSDNVNVAHVQVVGDGLAPSGGPSEIGFLLINSRGCDIAHNTVSAVNLDIFVRGGKAAGNRFLKNVIVGGPTAANNLLGICYNPAPGSSDPAGPRGDSIYNNHIARFGYAIAVSSGSVSNVFADNTLASFTGGIREPQNFTAQGGTNVDADNIATMLPTDNF
jgi:hypothetical protein